MVGIDDPNPLHADRRVIDALDDLLSRRHLSPTATVSNTIFPEQLARTSRDRGRLYDRYRVLLPYLKRIDPRNRRGTYFERLINFPLQRDRERANQLKIIIRDLRREIASPTNRPLGHIYEAQIFAPGKDRRPIGFPCMSSLSFHLDQRRLRLSATYRNQYYIGKALGNFIGLARLQRFVAEEAGLPTGPLSVHAFHAELEPRIPKSEITALLRTYQSLLPVTVMSARSA